MPQSPNFGFLGARINATVNWLETLVTPLEILLSVEFDACHAFQFADGVP
jgi:hypothetical protein